MGIQACSTPWSHCGVLVNAIPSGTWPYRMHRTHHPYKQIWAHSLPNGHLPLQLGEGQPHMKSKNKKKKPNVRFNILDEGYPFDNEGIAYIDKRL